MGTVDNLYISKKESEAKKKNQSEYQKINNQYSLNVDFISIDCRKIHSLLGADIK